MSRYTRESIKIDNILLDVENPRFASHFERLGKNAPSQKEVIDYLLCNESISTLASSIRETKGLHAAESIVCIKQGDEYVVLEGNRRVCACKVLCHVYNEKNTDCFPSDVLPIMPLLDDVNDAELIENISKLDAVVYENREAAQPYISDKHIDGVKKWESIEKSTYFYRMFHNKLKSGLIPENAVDEIAKDTISKKNDITDCITKYGFYMSVYNALLKKYQPTALTETNSFLPLVDRFMGAIVEKSDLGLGLPKSPQFNYIAHNGKESLFEEILILVGEAFLVRKPKDELPRINSQEVDNKHRQKKLIRDDVRIPGLLAALQAYKNAPSSESVDEQADDSNASESAASQENVKEAGNDNTTNNDKQTVGDTPPNEDKDDESPFENEIPWTPSKPLRRCLGFTKDEYSAFGLSDEDDGDVKIKFVIRELSRLSIADYPYSCSLLYRTLLESVTRKAFDVKKPTENGKIIEYQEKNLAGMIMKLTNNHLTLTDSNRGAIKGNISQQSFIATLNDYIHNPKSVDTNWLSSTWTTMKEYVKACLS